MARKTTTVDEEFDEHILKVFIPEDAVGGDGRRHELAPGA